MTVTSFLTGLTVMRSLSEKNALGEYFLTLIKMNHDTMFIRVTMGTSELVSIDTVGVC